MNISFYDNNRNSVLTLEPIQGSSEYKFIASVNTMRLNVFTPISLSKASMMKFCQDLTSLYNMEQDKVCLHSDDDLLNVSVRIDDVGHLDYIVDLRNENCHAHICYTIDITFIPEICEQIDMVINEQEPVHYNNRENQAKFHANSISLKLLDNDVLQISISLPHCNIYNDVDVSQAEIHELFNGLDELGKDKKSFSFCVLGCFFELTLRYINDQLWIFYNDSDCLMQDDHKIDESYVDIKIPLTIVPQIVTVDNREIFK